MYMLTDCSSILMCNTTNSLQLSDRPGTIVVEATGRGAALVQCTVQNHVTELPKPEPEVELEVDSEQNSDTKEINIEICARFVHLFYCPKQT